MTPWMHQNQEISEADIPEKALGFIYLIINSKTNMKYVGRKLLTKSGYRMVKGKRKKVRLKSDWESYWGSNALLLEDYEKDPESFQRIIVQFVFSKGELLYLEEKLQYLWKVLESEDWYNSNIRTKIFKKWVLKFPSNAVDFTQSLPHLLTTHRH